MIFFNRVLDYMMIYSDEDLFMVVSDFILDLHDVNSTYVKINNNLIE